MAEVKILVEGYARELKNGWNASSTVTLIKDEGKKIIVDPGCSRQKLLAALEKEKLKIEDIDFIFLTHSHLDHSLLAGIFSKSKIVTSEEVYDNDEQVSHEKFIPGTHIEIINTPGHCQEHCSLVVSTPQGICVVAGDVFWWTTDEKQEAKVDKVDEAHPKEMKMSDLCESRRYLLKIADYIIPGHGKMFKV